MDEMCRITPLLRSIIPGRKCLLQRTAAMKFKFSALCQCALPVLFRQSGVASIRSIRSSYAVDEDVDATPLVQDAVGKLRDTLHAAKIRLHKERGHLSLRQRRASGRSNRGPCRTKAAHNGLSSAFRSTRHEDTLVFELVGNKEMRVVHHGFPPHSCTGKSFSPYCDNGK